MFAEDLSSFFDVATGFAFAVTLTPAGGGAAAAGSVIFDEQGEVIDGEIVSASPTAHMPAAQWPAVAINDVLAIGARQFKVRQAYAIDDGAIKRLVLQRVAS